MRIAITGGIAEGKSTVLFYLKERGYSVASADQVAGDVFAEDDIQRAIGRLLQQAAPISREVLRERLEDPAIRREVNRLTHPRILKRLGSMESSFVEVPLLIEACIAQEFDRIWVVTCGVPEQRKRLAERLGSDDAAVKMIETQLSTRAKLAFADVIIRTNADEGDVQRCVFEAADAEMG